MAAIITDSTSARPMNGAALTSLGASGDSACRSSLRRGRRRQWLEKEAATIASSVIAGPGQFTDNLAPRKDQHAVAGEQFGVFGGVPDERASLAGEFAAEPVEILLGGDVDAARRVVQAG